MANKYPPSFSVLEPMIPVVRRALIEDDEAPFRYVCAVHED